MKKTLVFLVCVCLSLCQEVCQKDNMYEEEDCSGVITSQRVVRLSNGVLMPEVGLGTWKVTGEEEVFLALDASLASGYRLIDTAVAYNNHREISRALDTLLPEYQLTRKDIFLTTKIPVGPLKDGGASLADCRAGLDQMLEELATEYLDLLLIHSPPATEEMRREAWQCLEQFYRDGKTRAVGVSNYEIHHLEEIATFATVSPQVNQIYYNPKAVRAQSDLVSYCNNHKVHLTAFSSLGHAAPNRLINNKVTANIAKKYDKSTAQVLLRWATQQGFSIIPKSLNPEHIKLNIDLNFSLKVSDLERISSVFE